MFSELVFVEKDFLISNKVEYREYQINIAEKVRKKNSLIVLPTGLGKTIIALLVIADKLTTNKGKILFLAPTKPLVNQHKTFLQSFLKIKKDLISVFTGEVPPKKRINLWQENTIIISTPQVIENDLVSRRISLNDVSLIIFDEAHHATGKYAYVYINEIYQKQNENAHTLAMTASPGNDLEKITEICKNLSIEHVEIRTKHDADVKPFVHEIHFSWKNVKTPEEFSYPLLLLQKALRDRLKQLKDINVIDSASVSSINKTKLLDAQKKIQAEIRSRLNPPKILFTAAASQSEALKLLYSIEILQTQGVQAFKHFFQRIQNDANKKSGSKSAKNLIADTNVLDALASISTIKIEHPKLDEVEKIVKDQLKSNSSSRIIIFTHYRDTSKMVYDRLNDIEDVKPIRFIGQGTKINDKGLTQKQQKEIINKFRRGEFNVLVATSVAEEGLDIPTTELVLFYEPIPSEIRNIQRRGRTARKKPGNVVILITKGTPDEGYYWASKRKEKLMHTELERIRSSLKRRLEIHSASELFQIKEKTNQTTINSYEANANNILKIIVDHREFRSPVARYISKQDVEIEPSQLPVGDYIVSSRIGIERKDVNDFLNSLLNGHLFNQVKRLRDAFSRPILIIEGDGLFTKRNINHNAIFGCLVSIMVDYGIPIINTKDEVDTADLLIVMAKREQNKDQNKSVALRGDKNMMNMLEQQQFIIEGFPQISSVIAKRLLEHFGSIRAISNADEEELQQVQGVGKKIAEDIHRVINEQYQIN